MALWQLMPFVCDVQLDIAGTNVMLCLGILSTLASLVPATCNCTSCAQLHELPENQCDDNLSFDASLENT